MEYRNSYLDVKWSARSGPRHRDASRSPYRAVQAAREVEQQLRMGVALAPGQVRRRDRQAGAGYGPALEDDVLRHGIPCLEGVGHEIDQRRGVGGEQRVGVAVEAEDDDAERDFLIRADG